MIRLSQDALVAAGLNTLSTPPTHAKSVRIHKMNVDPADTQLASLAPALKQLVEGTYVYGLVSAGREGPDFARMQNTPIVHVVLDLNASYARESYLAQPNAPGLPADQITNLTKRNRAALAANNLIAAGVVPVSAQPWLTSDLPNLPAWEFRENDFDAVAALTDPRLEGSVE